MGSTYQWSAPTLGTGLSGGSAGGPSGSVNDLLTNTTTSPVTAIYTVSPASSYGCTGAPFTLTMSINASPLSASITVDVIDPCNGGHTSYVDISGGASPYSFTLACSGSTSHSGGSYTNMTVPIGIDAQGSDICTISNILDANACPAPPASPNTAAYLPVSMRTLTSGMTQTCTVLAFTTKTFYDAQANLMVTLTTGSTGLGQHYSRSRRRCRYQLCRQIRPVECRSCHSTPIIAHTHRAICKGTSRSRLSTQAPANVCLYVSDADATGP